MKLPLVAIVLCAACGGGNPDPGDDVVGDDVVGDDTPPEPTALARCADPALPIDQAWEVDNIRAPLHAQTQLGSTILVTSADGAVKTWNLPATGGAPSAPGYGTPFVDEGDPVSAVGFTPPSGVDAFVGLDALGRAHVWSPTGAVLAEPVALLPDALPGTGAFVAIDKDATWIAGGSSTGTPLAVADLATGEVTPLVTEMWNVAAATIAGDKLITVGHWYGAAAIEVRDLADPATVLAYWDGAHTADGAFFSGWIRAVAVDAGGTTAITVGDGLYLRFDLANVAAGPTADLMLPDDHFEHLVWSEADDVAIALGPRGETESALTVFSTLEDRVTRSVPVPAAIGLSADAEAALVVMARADGMVRGVHCGE
jgi:hypothetical protein